MNYFTIYINFINHEEVIVKNKGSALSPQERFLLSYIANFPEKQGFTGSVENLESITRKNRKSLLKTLKKLVDIEILEKSDIPHFRTKKYKLTKRFQEIYDIVKEEKDRFFHVRLDFLENIDEIDLTDMMLISYISSFNEGYCGYQRDLISVLGIGVTTLSKKIKNKLFIKKGGKICLTDELEKKLKFSTVKV